MTQWILHHIAEPTVRGMADEDTPFTGVLYCGLMMTARGPQVLEFNARFGDPETQAILMRLEVGPGGCAGSMRRRPLSADGAPLEPGASACVVASSSGYPGSTRRGADQRTGGGGTFPGVEVFHAGTARATDQIVTAAAACWE